MPLQLIHAPPISINCNGILPFPTPFLVRPIYFGYAFSIDKMPRFAPLLQRMVCQKHREHSYRNVIQESTFHRQSYLIRFVESLRNDILLWMTHFGLRADVNLLFSMSTKFMKLRELAWSDSCVSVAYVLVQYLHVVPVQFYPLE